MTEMRLLSKFQPPDVVPVSQPERRPHLETSACLFAGPPALLTHHRDMHCEHTCTTRSSLASSESICDDHAEPPEHGLLCQSRDRQKRRTRREALQAISSMFAFSHATRRILGEPFYSADHANPPKTLMHATMYFRSSDRTEHLPIFFVYPATTSIM